MKISKRRSWANLKTLDKRTLARQKTVESTRCKCADVHTFSRKKKTSLLYRLCAQIFKLLKLLGYLPLGVIVVSTKMAAPVFYIAVRLPLSTISTTTVLLQWSSQHMSHWARREMLRPWNITGCMTHRRWYGGGTGGKQGQGQSTNMLARYLRSLKWVPIPMGVGFAYICYQQFGHIRKREKRVLGESIDLARDWQVMVYRMIPLRGMSRLWGKVNSLDLPTWLRSPIYMAYSKAFDCKIEEAAIQDLQHYKNLGEFFRRKLKVSARPIDQKHPIVCPADGRILHLGKVDMPGKVEQVKGVTYSLKEFLGPATWMRPSGDRRDSRCIDGQSTASSYELHRCESAPANLATVTTERSEVHLLESFSSETDGLQSKAETGSDEQGKDHAYQRSLCHCSTSNTALYHCVIYLAPGDYHAFHSPASWDVAYRRHFPGELMSVNPRIARWISGLFNYNERVVLAGEWEFGFFSMTAVGATNVGSIRIHSDYELHTNLKHWRAGTYFDKDFQNPKLEIAGVPFRKGEVVGEFNLGSTIVLIFEAPNNFHFTKKPGDRVKVGEALGDITSDV
ncbi:PREDICTED: phosphatidylserine decarboxylase proenzyme-like [Priapulus caudatus]|uniref:Phosphatidylserine decarboxylase proenzyme, mitochondrial n=1 Tax=Priapulus caudatus TaxID=37621 RepID=A0ABM1DUK8_PRICU|nr:PREDICTED: phosphatidylserine decarboxylase proenzyme-like [Priapulus caudatus]